MKVTVIKTKIGYVSRFSAQHQIVQVTDSIDKAKKFRTTADVNHWLDLYVNCGYGLDWVTSDIKLEVWTK